MSVGFLWCHFAGLVHEDCIAKMRLMSLVDLALSESGQIPYAAIKDTLKVESLAYIAIYLALLAFSVSAHKLFGSVAGE